MKKFFLLFFSCLVTATTHANGTVNQFTPPADDASVKFLQQMLGGVVGMVSSGGNNDTAPTDSLLGGMMWVFNSAILFVGMLFVAYTTIKGTVDSAHDGELLGRKMSSFWVPLRTAVGAPLLLPLSSGFSLIQVAIIWLALQGVGIADAMWSTAIKQFSQQSVLATPMIPKANALAAGILKSQVCAGAMNKHFAESGQSTRITPVTLNSTAGTPSGTGIAGGSYDSPLSHGMTGFAGAQYGTTGYQWNAGTGYAMNPNVCGGVIWQSSWTGRDGSTAAIKQSLLTAHSQAVQTMIGELQPVADLIVSGQKPMPGIVEKAAQHYSSTLSAAAQALSKQTSGMASRDFLQAANGSGWIYAGAWYNYIARLNDVMISTLASLPETSTINITKVDTELALQNYNDAMAVTDAYLKTPVEDQITEIYSKQTDLGSREGWDNPVRKIISSAFMGMISGLTNSIAGDHTNHLSQMKSFGDYLIGTGEAILTGITLMSVTSSSAIGKGVEALTGLGAAPILQVLGPMITILCFGLFSLGVMLSTYIPMIPFITWVTSVANWFVLVFEAIIAGPIFAVAHIHPDGDDAVGKAGNGYMFILSLVLRPALMIVGLICAMLLTEPLAGIVNVAFMTVVAGIQVSSTTGIVSFIAYVAIYVSIMMTVVHTAFSLIHWIPDNILRWIGGRGDAMVNAERQGGESHQVFAAGISRGEKAIHAATHGSKSEQDTKSSPSNPDLFQ